MSPTSRFERWLERSLVPPVSSGSLQPTPSGEADAPVVRIDDFRRVVAVVASTAVGFFVPSLVLASVPVDLWLPFSLAAAFAGLIIGGSFYLFPDGSGWAMPMAVVNSLIIGGLAVVYGDYYNQLPLLFALIVAGHAIVHGIRPALIAAVSGGLVIPLLIQPRLPTNASDPIYALIYLSGAALIPWTASRLARRRASALREQLALTLSTEREAVMILARASEAKDHVTGDHVVRVGDISAELGRRAGLSAAEVDDLRFAGMLHDVGKLRLPDTLLKKRGPLTAAEWDLVKQHTIWGERILGTSEGFELARRIARSHHENFDGSGYPDGLRGREIPFAARIVRLADVFDALRNERSYKEPWSLARTLEEIERGAGRHFDPELARELVALFEEDPAWVPGGLVTVRTSRKRRHTRATAAPGLRPTAPAGAP
jgi:hypothetical protein